MTVIREFFHDGGVYYHDLNLNDDSVSLVCLEREKLLTYDYGGVARTVDGEIWGRFTIKEGAWVFTYGSTGGTLQGNPTTEVEGLLNFEVKVSRIALDTIFFKD